MRAVRSSKEFVDERNQGFGRAETPTRRGDASGSLARSPPPTTRGNRRATMSPIYLTEGIVIPDADLYWRFSRSSGPGGQGVNTTDSRVELSFNLAGTTALPPHLRQRAIENLRKRMAGGAVTVAVSEHRSQLRNRRTALERMEALLQKAIAPPPPKRKPTKPTRGSVRRRLKEKKRRSDIKKLRRNTED